MSKTWIAVMALALFCVNAEARLYKWVDKGGVTHYGEVIPAEYAGQDATQLNQQGVEIKPSKQAPGAKPAQPSPQQADQARRDQALLNSYTSPEDIDNAREHNLQQANARITSIQARIKYAQDNLADYRKEQDARVKAGQEVPASLSSDIQSTQTRITNLKNDLNNAQSDADKIRERYDADKKRFLELSK
jgi:chromosome segregation ATPase